MRTTKTSAKNTRKTSKATKPEAKKMPEAAAPKAKASKAKKVEMPKVEDQKPVEKANAKAKKVGATNPAREQKALAVPGGDPGPGRRWRTDELQGDG